MEEIKRISEVLPEENLGDVVPTKDLVGKEIVLMGATPRSGDYGDYYAVLFSENDSGDVKTFFCGGVVVSRKLSFLIKNDLFPVKAKLVESGDKRKYYDLV